MRFRGQVAGTDRTVAQQGVEKGLRFRLQFGGLEYGPEILLVLLLIILL